jgi:8-oxo-dGTP pyrophosphatase MutT (NUDIX family)
MMVETVKKVIAYVTKGDDLLVFEHRDFPEAGLQVPAGSLKEGETPEEAVLREVIEETGLEQVRIVRFLGRYSYDMATYRPEVQDRFVFHVSFAGPAPSTWLHYENHDGKSEPTAFCLYWLKLDDPRLKLISGQGDYLWKLRDV